MTYSAPSRIVTPPSLMRDGGNGLRFTPPGAGDVPDGGPTVNLHVEQQRATGGNEGTGAPAKTGSAYRHGRSRGGELAERRPGYRRAASSVPCLMARSASSSTATAAPPMMCGSIPLRRKPVFEVAHGFLARADHHVVDLEQTAVGAVGPEADVQAVVVDALVVNAGQLHALGLQRSAVHPEPDCSHSDTRIAWGSATRAARSAGRAYATSCTAPRRIGIRD